MFDIVYEDSDIIVVNKPAGIVVHPDEHITSGTLIQELVKERPEIESASWRSEENKERPGIVHRLDKDTSGLLLITKNNEAFAYYKNLFQSREIKKTYLALVEGVVKKDSGIIDVPIGRSKKDPRMRVASHKAFGKLRPAQTEFKVLQRFKDCSLLEARPLTGRTHQIRAHLKAIGYPIVCDLLYNRRGPCPTGLSRQFLHAVELEFKTMDGKILQLTSKLPEDLENTLKRL